MCCKGSRHLDASSHSSSSTSQRMSTLAEQCIISNEVGPSDQPHAYSAHGRKYFLNLIFKCICIRMQSVCKPTQTHVVATVKDFWNWKKVKAIVIVGFITSLAKSVNLSWVMSKRWHLCCVVFKLLQPVFAIYHHKSITVHNVIYLVKLCLEFLKRVTDFIKGFRALRILVRQWHLVFYEFRKTKLCLLHVLCIH